MLDYQRASTVDECWFPKLSAYLRVGSSTRLQVLPIPPDFPVPKDPKEDFTVTFGPCANLMIYTGHECHEAMGIITYSNSLIGKYSGVVALLCQDDGLEASSPGKDATVPDEPCRLSKSSRISKMP